MKNEELKMKNEKCFTILNSSFFIDDATATTK
jgi:hypothetical protein